MDITDMHAVTPDEASYEVTKALLPSREGAPRGYAIEPPPNWKDLTYALDIMETIFDTKGWTRSIQRDDGVIFLVDLGYAQRGMVQVVL